MGVFKEQERNVASWVCAAMVLLGSIATGRDMADDTGEHSISRTVLAGDINNLDWERAGAFEFVWDSAELSVKVSNPDSDVAPEANMPILTISGRVNIVDANNVATIDVSSVGVWEVLDEN